MYQVMDGKVESKQKAGGDMKTWRCSDCKCQHSITQLVGYLKQKLDEEVKFKLLQSPPFVLSSFYHYISGGGTLNESILKKLPVEKWVEQSLLNDLCNKSLQNDIPVTLDVLDQLRCIYGISITEKILFNLRKFHPLSLLDISDILTCILESETYTPECSKESDWLFKLKYSWIEQKLQQSSFSPMKENLIEQLARSRLHLEVIEFIIYTIDNDTEHVHLEELFKFIEDNNLSEKDIFCIMKQQNVSKDINDSRAQSWLNEMQMTFLIKSQSQINMESSLLLKTYLGRLMKQGYPFCTIKKLVHNNFITNENIFIFVEIINLIMDYQIDDTTLDKISPEIEQKQPSLWLETVNRLIVDATFGEKEEYELSELIDKILETSSNNCNFTKDTLKIYYDRIKTASNEPSKLFGLLTDVSEDVKSMPIKSWKQEQLTQWAKCIKTDKIALQELLEEIVAGVIQGIKLHYNLCPRDTQILTVCMLLNSKKKRGCLAQVPTGEGKSLIIAMLAVVHGLLGRKVDIITTSTELSIPETKKQATFFELFNLTVGENSDLTSKQTVYNRDIVYGTASYFQADILRSEFDVQPIRGDRGFGVVLVDEVDSMLFDQRTQSTRLSEKLPAMDHLELVLANIWCLLNLTKRHLIRKDDTYLFIVEDFSMDTEGNVVTASKSRLEECGVVIKDPLDFLKQIMEENIQKNLRPLNPVEENKKTEYEELNAKSAALCKSLEQIKNEMKLKIQHSFNTKKQKADELINEIEKLKNLIEEIDESNEKHNEALNKHDELVKEFQQVQEDIEKEVDSELHNKKKSKEEEQLKLQEELKKAAWLDEYPVIDVPNHLLEFARQQIPHWVKSALDALYCFQRNKHYAVEGGKIVPINYNDTGVFQPNMVWGNGLTQFLQMKEGLKIQPEGVATNYLSIHGFFKKYNHHVYGVTGTLGERSTQEFFEEVYETDQIKIPPHSVRVINHPTTSHYQCKEFPTQIISDEESWIEAICKSCLVQLKVKRCVLVICQYVSQVESLAEKLVNVHNYPEDKVFMYTGRNEEKFLKTDLSPSEIVVATNIAGRGTDLSVNPKAEENGGLHVCITFLPPRFRVELQNVGRTARKGQRGSAQLILHDSSGTTIDELKANRSEKEAEALKNAKGDIGKIKLQDQLFVNFCHFLGTLFPNMSQLHKMKERMQLEDAFECERDAVSDNDLEEAFNKHIDGLRAERLALLQQDPMYTQYSPSEVDSAFSAIEKEINMYQKTEYFTWKTKYEEQIRKDFCTKWKGRVSYDVLESFGLHISLSTEKSVTSSSLDYYDRLGVTEQWGIWLHMTFSTEKMKSEKEVVESFTNFTENLKQQVEKGTHIQNPFYYIKKGNFKLHEKDVDTAIQCYEKAIEMDPRKSLYAHVNLARAYLTKSPKKEMQVKAKKHYQEALNLIDNFDKPSLLQLYAIMKQTEGGEKTSEHVSHQLDILQVIENHTDMAIEVINEVQEKDMEVAVTKVESLENIFKGGDGTKEYSHALDEAKVNGMTHLATLEAREPTPWLNVVGVTLLGICEIAVGVLTTIYTEGTLREVGEGLIVVGVSHIIAGVKSAITGWATWAMEKAVCLSTLLICAGYNSIKRKLKAIKDTEISTNCFENGLKLAMIQVGMALAKGVAKEALTYISDLTTAKELTEHVATVIEETVGNVLLEAFEKNELIQKALSIDTVNQENVYEQLLIREGMNLLKEREDSSNVIMKLLTGIWRGVIGDQANDIAIDQLNTATKDLDNIADIEKMREKLKKFTEKFLQLYMTQIEIYRDKIEKDEYKIKGHASEQQETASESNDKSQQCKQISQEQTMTPERKEGSQYHEKAFQQQTLPENDITSVQHERASPKDSNNDKFQQHKKALLQQTAAPESEINTSEQHEVATQQQTTPESYNTSQQYEQASQKQTIPPECVVNEDNFGIHDADSGQAYSTTQPQTSTKSSFYVPSKVDNLKKAFVKSITRNVTDSVRENLVQPRLVMETQLVLDYFSDRTQKSIHQQRMAYGKEMRSNLLKKSDKISQEESES